MQEQADFSFVIFFVLFSDDYDTGENYTGQAGEELLLTYTESQYPASSTSL